MSIITTNEALISLCERLSQSPYITVDTEFLRDKTYYSKLCLIQVANDEEFHAIDALASNLDLKPFYDLMENKNVLKVFHAARQDVEIFVNMAGIVPAPLFDSQVAAMVCGYGDSIGYEKLVLSLANETLDKSARVTDWSRRPLTQRQLNYALGDVTHLRIIYKKLAQQLNESGRAHWLSEEMDELTSVETYQIDPQRAYKRIKIRNSNRRYNALVRHLAEWRELEAQSRNIPRNRIMRDEVLLELAAVRPTHANALSSVRGLSPQFSQSKQGRDIIAMIDKVLALSDDELPDIKRKSPIKQNIDPIMELLKVFLKYKCQSENVAPKLLATTDDLEKLSLDDSADIAALKGWRYELFGKEALAIKNGEYALTVREEKITLIPLEPENITDN